MAKIIVLGGCRTVGTAAVKTLASNDEFSEVVIGDFNIGKAKELVAQLGSRKVSAVKVDAEDEKSIKDAVKDGDVVLNCVGPFYKTVKFGGQYAARKKDKKGY